MTGIVYSTALGMHILVGVCWGFIPAISLPEPPSPHQVFRCWNQHGRLSQALLFFWLAGLAGIRAGLSVAKETGNVAIGTGLCVMKNIPDLLVLGLFLFLAATDVDFDLALEQGTLEIFGGRTAHNPRRIVCPMSLL